VNRTRPIEALLAALATIAVTLPVTTLFAPDTWFRPSVILVLVVALAGMGLRRVTAHRPLVVLGQATALVYVASLLHGRGHLWADLVPTPDTGLAFGILLTQAQETVTISSAPAPSNRGTILAISLLVGLTALAVDAIGVTYRSPALAGIPLLSAFLGSATNSGDGLAAWYAVPAALCWLALMGRQSVGSLRAWGTSAPGPSGRRGPDPATAFATTGRIVGVAALAAAVVVPAVVPHLPTTFIADGLGQSSNARGGGPGSSVQLSSTVDIARDLESRSDAPVLRYRTSSEDLQPLRVGILDNYRRGQWQATQEFSFVPIDGQIPAPLAGPEVPRRVERLEVTDNAVGVPQVALPAGTVDTSFADGTWNVTVGGVVQLTAPSGSYSAEYVELDPEAEQFATEADPDLLGIDRSTLELDRRSEDEVRALLTELTDDGDSALEVARTVQAYLRSSEFTYSLDLAEDDGTLPSDPLARFLETKRGYCVQFSTAMIMLSRAAGIPARMAVGFLPGVPDGDERVVRVSDAHAWPELYFPQLGWVRFEPTPATQSSAAPDYSLAPTDPAATASPTPSATTPSSSAAPSAAPTRDLTDAGGMGAADTGGFSIVRFVSDNALTLLAVLLAALAVSAVPFGAWLARRRSAHAARDDADRVEAQWQSLLLRLQDIGYVPPDGTTPRQASRQIGHATYLTPDEKEALGRVVATVELARYARPGADLHDVRDDAQVVWRGALSKRRRLDRVRALLLPAEGRGLWRSTFRFRRPAPGGDTDSDND
jgi:transglutaminase-like putative cysteine protease